MTRAAAAPLRRMGLVLLFPLIVTGAVGNMVMGDDYSSGPKEDLAGNIVWLILLTTPVWVPLTLLRWLATGKT